MKQTGDINQLISDSDCAYLPSHLSCLYFSLWGYFPLDLAVFYSLKSLLETLQKLQGFIIRLYMPHSNVTWKLNWTENFLCILRPMPACAEWIAGGLSQFLTNPILNLDRKQSLGAKEAFIFQILFPLSFMVWNLIKLFEVYLPSRGWWKWEYESIYFWKERARSMKTSTLSILATCKTKTIRIFFMKFFSQNIKHQMDFL